VSFSAKSPWRRWKERCRSGQGFINKLVRAPAFALSSLSSRCGDEKREEMPRSSGSGKIREAATSIGGAHQRRPRFADVTHGHRGQSALGCWFKPSSLFLHVLEDLLRPRRGSVRRLRPKWFVPGGVAGARVWRSRWLCGEVKGPDCFSVFYSRALLAKFEDCAVTSFSFSVLYVICTPL
jgi:hypothetical protein